MDRTPAGDFRGPGWRNLSIRSKLALVFGAQLLIIVAMGLTASFALSSAQGQRENLRNAQRIETLAGDLELEFIEAREIQTRLIFGWEEVGFRAAADEALPAHGEMINEIRETTGEIESLLVGSSLPNARRSLRNTQTLVAVADFYQVRFVEAVDTLGLLADEESGALAVLQDRGAGLQQRGSDLADDEVVTAILVMRREEDNYRRSGNPVALQTISDQAEFLDQRLNLLDTTVPSGQVQETRQALNDYASQVQVVEGLRADVEEQIESLDNLVNEAEPIWDEIVSFASQDGLAAAAEADRAATLARAAVIGGIAIASILGALVTSLLWRDFAERLGRLAQVAQRLEDGDLSARADLVGRDEFGRLGETLNGMAQQVEGVISGLATQSKERTRDLEIIAEVSRTITSLRAPSELLREVVELIRVRFGFYHVQVFLVDDTGEYAVLRESTGEAGRALLSQGHRLAVGSRSVIGQVTSGSEPVIALDTDTDAIHRRNELLPDTRSEMALPLRIGDEVIGALDVQSVEPFAFDEDDVAVFRTMADQLAVALRNAELFAASQASLNEVEGLNRRLVGLAWDRFVARRDPAQPRAYRIEGGDVVPEANGLSPELIEQLDRESVVRLKRDESGELEVAVPIRVRGEVIGAFGFGGEELADLSDNDLELIGAVAERVGIALENVRLFEQTQQQAHREQLVNEITQKIVGSTDVNDILQTTARELGRVLRAPETRIELRGVEDNE